MITGLCAKVTTKATLIAKDGKRYIGMNWCKNPQPKCPRLYGEGYDKCINICEQYGHAEVMACMMAGKNATDGTLYLEGHTYACKNCLRVMGEYGVNLVIGSPPKIENTPPLSRMD